MQAIGSAGTSGVGRQEAVAPPELRPGLSRIEREYQVAQDRVETWSPKILGTVPIGTIGGARDLTATEGKLLDRLTFDRGFVGLQRFRAIADDAFATADRRMVPAATIPPAVQRTLDALPPDARAEAIEQWPRNDGHNDAFRHSYWNARLTAEFGEAWTAQFTTAHEGSNVGASTREAMDLYNNEVGRRIAVDNPGATPQRLADLVRRALDQGQLVVIDRNGHLNWSNQVANGHHGVSTSLTVRDAMPIPAGDASVR